MKRCHEYIYEYIYIEIFEINHIFIPKPYLYGNFTLISFFFFLKSSSGERLKAKKKKKTETGLTSVHKKLTADARGRTIVHVCVI